MLEIASAGSAPQEQADGAVGEGSDVIGGFDNHGGEVEQRGGRGLGGEVGEGGPNQSVRAMIMPASLSDFWLP